MRVRLFILFIFISNTIFGIEIETQDSTKKIQFNYKADFMSQHLWRGYAMCDVPSVEPSVDLFFKGIGVGIWSAVSIDGKYFELDTYLKYTYQGFSFGIYDYYCPGSISSNHSVFNFSRYNTKHTIDLHFEYEWNSSFPLKVLVATMIYGDDLNIETNKNQYSTYLELAYYFKIENFKVEYFVGYNPFKSYYGEKPAIINAGIKSKGILKLFRNKQIPLQASIVNNPLTNKIYMVFGFEL